MGHAERYRLTISIEPVLSKALDHDAITVELNPLSKTVGAYTNTVATGSVALAGIKIRFYAIVYHAVGATLTLAASLYFSTIAYAAIGFSACRWWYHGLW